MHVYIIHIYIYLIYNTYTYIFFSVDAIVELEQFGTLDLFLGWERGAELLLLPPILGNPFFWGPPHPKVGSNRRYFHGPGCYKPRQMVKTINLWAKS